MEIFTRVRSLSAAPARRTLCLKFNIGYGSDIEETKQITLDTLLASKRIVREPEPKVVITDLAAEGISVTANFRINSNENRPQEVFDEVASTVLGSLGDARIEVFPPSSVYMEKPALETSSDAGRYTN